MAYGFLAVLIAIFKINILPFYTAFYSAFLCVFFLTNRRKKAFSPRFLLSDFALLVWTFAYPYTVLFLKPDMQIDEKNFSLFLFCIPAFLFFITLILFITSKKLEHTANHSSINILISSISILIILSSVFENSKHNEFNNHTLLLFIFYLSISFLGASILTYFYNKVYKTYKYIYLSSLMIFLIATVIYFFRICKGVSYYHIDYILFAFFPFFYNYAYIKAKETVSRSPDSNNMKIINKIYHFYFSSNVVFFMSLYLVSLFLRISSLIDEHTFFILLGLSVFNLTVNLIFSYGYFNEQIVKKEKEENVKLELYVLDQIENLKRTNEELREKVAYDSVTGLYNLESLYAKINELIENNYEYFSIMSLNIDDFKTLNNVYGHEIGDKFLLKFAKRLEEEFYEEDTFVFRVDSDEFSVLFVDVSFKGINKVSSRIYNVMHTPLEIEGKSFVLDYSASIVRYPIDATSTSELVQGLSVAMDESKKIRNDKSAVFFSNSIMKSIEKRHKFEAYFRNVIMEKDFSILVNQYFDLNKEKVSIIRPELRWLNLEYHDYKDSIHQYAESIGFLDKLFRWFLNRFFETFAREKENYPNIEKISLRLYSSVESLVRFIPLLENKLKLCSIPLSMICFEINSELLDSLQYNYLNTFNRLREQDVDFIVREFGVGYTSLNNIKKLQIKKLIVDESLITNIDTDAQEIVVLESVINIAKGMRIKILIEGLERISQFFVIKDFDCDYASGSYIAEALDINEFFKPKEENYII